MKTNKILNTIHETIRSASEAGVVDELTLREFDALCLPEVREFSPEEIRQLRKKNKASQAVLAKFMNMSPSAIQQWERGDKKPRGASLKLLNLVERNGLLALV